MSANNLVYIQEKQRKGKTYFTIVMKDAETGVSLGRETKVSDLRTAIEEANKIQDNEVVEYGLQIDLKK